jgi:hypothetical protein
MLNYQNNKKLSMNFNSTITQLRRYIVKKLEPYRPLNNAYEETVSCRAKKQISVLSVLKFRSYQMHSVCTYCKEAKILQLL